MMSLQLVLCTCDLFTLIVKISLVPGLAPESANGHDSNAALTTLVHKRQNIGWRSRNETNWRSTNFDC